MTVGPTQLRLLLYLSQGSGRHPHIPFDSAMTKRFPRILPEPASNFTTVAVNENLDQCTERLRFVMDSLIAKSDKEGVKSIFIASHASPCHAIASALIPEISQERRALTWYMAGLTKAVRQTDGSWKLEWQSRTDFLSGERVSIG